MDRRIARLSWRAWQVFVALLTLAVVTVSSLMYLTGSLPAPEFILANSFASPFLTIHIIGSVVALLLGPLQFLRSIRARRPALHRAIGRTYFGACAMGALAGLPLAIGSAAGPIAGAGFAIAAVLWLIFTYLGVQSALEGRFPEHREWMIRSYAMTFNGITLRLLTTLAVGLGLEFFSAYRVIAWLIWLINLPLFEMYIRRTRSSTTTEGRLATA